MKMLILVLTILMCLFVKQVHAQPITNWGNGNCEAQLSINLDTNTVNIGSTLIVSVQVKNLSTNYSYIIETFPLKSSSAFLTNNAGFYYKFSQLRSPSWEQSFGGKSAETIESGKTYAWTLALEIGKDIPLGNYRLQVARTILTAPPYLPNHKRCELMSNILDVQIK